MQILAVRSRKMVVQIGFSMWLQQQQQPWWRQAANGVVCCYVIATSLRLCRISSLFMGCDVLMISVADRHESLRPDTWIFCEYAVGKHV